MRNDQDLTAAIRQEAEETPQEVVAHNGAEEGGESLCVHCDQSDEAAYDMFDKLDATKDGQLNYDDIEAFVRQKREQLAAPWR